MALQFQYELTVMWAQVLDSHLVGVLMVNHGYLKECVTRVHSVCLSVMLDHKTSEYHQMFV